MKFKLSLEVLHDQYGNALPINYQYELSAVIYRILSYADSDYSAWLHDNGFQPEAGGKNFKLFAFSNLIVPNFGIDREHQRLLLNCNTVYWYISFLPEKSTQKFIQGVFKEQVFQLGDRISKVEFAVRDIQILPPLEYQEEMTFKTLSPVCITQREADGRTTYLAPTAPNYEAALLKGLTARYEALYGSPYQGESYCHFHLLSEPRSKLVKIKSDTDDQTLVRGFLYDFSLSLPEPLMYIACEGGIGEKTSLGFGMIEEQHG